MADHLQSDPEDRRREAIRALSPSELAGRRSAFDALAPPCVLCEGSGHLADDSAFMDVAGMPCDSCIEGRVLHDAGDLLKRLGREREALEATTQAPADELARVRVAERVVGEHCRAGTEWSTGPAPEAPRSLNPATRREIDLLDAEVERRVTTQLATERTVPSPIVCEVLGPYPHGDASKSLAWNEGARALCTYRARYGVMYSDTSLGDPPLRATERAEYSRAQRHIEAAQRRLGRSADRAAQRALGHSQDIGL